MRLNFLFIPLFSLFIILSAVLFNSLSSTAYKKEFQNLNVYREFQDDIIKVNNLAANVINYLKGSIAGLESSLFTEREIKHMEDVKNIFTKIKIIYIIIGIILTVYMIYIDNITRSNLILYSGLTSLIIISLFSALLLDFDYSFMLFHKITFNNDLWILDAGSTLIKMFPQEFFANIFKSIIKDSFMISILAMVYGYNIKKHYKSGKSACS